MNPCTYIMASKPNGTLYVGVTSNLVQRVYQHKQNLLEGFTKKYSVHTLVCFELHADMYAAITREKQIKKWNRQWKIDLIQSQNPKWLDLWANINT
ncbi:MAG: putative endonuclease [Oceanicoccus sp.]|jgi:putative endonuclease